MHQDFGLMRGHTPLKNLWRGKVSEKVSKYLVLKGSKDFRGACGATKKTRYILIFAPKLTPESIGDRFTSKRPLMVGLPPVAPLNPSLVGILYSYIGIAPKPPVFAYLLYFKHALNRGDFGPELKHFSTSKVTKCLKE